MTEYEDKRIVSFSRNMPGKRLLMTDSRSV